MIKALSDGVLSISFSSITLHAVLAQQLAMDDLCEEHGNLDQLSENKPQIAKYVRFILNQTATEILLYDFNCFDKRSSPTDSC